MGFDLVRSGAACPEPWLLLDCCDEVVVVVDYAFSLIYRNFGASKLLSQTSELLVGRLLWDVLPQSVGDIFEAGIREAVAARQPCVLDAELFSGGRLIGRGFPCRDDAFALFMRTTDDGEGVSRVREQTTLYSPDRNDTHSIALEVALREREAAVRESERGREFQRRFLTEVLANVTDGRLCLCSRDSDLPALLPMIGEAVLLTTPQSLAPFRRKIEAVGAVVGLPYARTQELIITGGEAAMNCIVHAGGGIATMCGVPGGTRMQIYFADTGDGIADDLLHRATLERGYTTVRSLGLGFTLMHSIADRVYLFTRPSGTTVILEQNAVPEPEKETLFHVAIG